MDAKLEAVVVPVSDVDRSRHFYRVLGFRLDLDRAEGDVRVVRLTLPGSPCSIMLGTGITTADPGSAVGMLTVTDLEAALAQLRARGVVLSSTSPCATGSACATFRDPDGNTWLLVEDVPPG